MSDVFSVLGLCATKKICQSIENRERLVRTERESNRVVSRLGIEDWASFDSGELKRLPICRGKAMRQRTFTGIE